MEEILDKQEMPQNIVPNPWRRFFARTFDLSIYNVILRCILVFLFRLNTDGISFVQIFETIISGFMMVLIEPILLSKLGTTPGKWLFGLVLRDKNDNKLSYIDGLLRTFYVFKNGMGFAIPLYNIYRQYQSYEQCIQKNEMYWDEGFSYRIKDEKGIRFFGYISGCIILIIVTVIIGLQGILPIHRGDITAEEYYENCNDFMAYNHMDIGMEINSLGEWIDTNYDSGIRFMSSEPPKHQVVYNGGEIQKVIIEIELTDESFISSYSNQLVMGYVSLVGAEKSMTSRALYDKEIINYLIDSFSNFEFEKAGIKITNEVDYSGYDKTEAFLIPNEGEEQYFHLRFVMERN